MKKVFSVILLVLIFIVLLFNIVSIFEFSFFGFRIFKVATGSMEPTLAINSIIVVKKTNDLNIGDIITFQDSRGYTTTSTIVCSGNWGIIASDYRFDERIRE